MCCTYNLVYNLGKTLSAFNNLGEILPKSPLSPNLPFSQPLQGPSNWVNLFAQIISSTTLAKVRQNRHSLPNSPTSRGPSSWFNLFAVIISSTTFAKSRQICRFRQIRQHFGVLLAGLIYVLLSFRQQPWKNSVKTATFAKFAFFTVSANILGPY